jgi:23S rRNA (guanosine2251-2'-O)-methyltransferase|tara:strand:+ start:134 stop:865 length:732 start_codon:yes stop_codon:yes gene_type:complete
MNTIYGIRSILEAIESKINIDKVWLLKGQKSGLSLNLENELKKNNISYSFVPIERLERFKSKNHQGAVASISPIIFDNLEDVILKNISKKLNPIYLVLENITDMRNIGAIIRSASATGVTNIILPKTESGRINDDTVKTSSGAIFSVSISKVDHIKDAIFLLKSKNIEIISITEKANNTIYETELKKPLAIVMGSEKKGISKSVTKMSDKSAKLPMKGKISSLNVSVACATVLYEIIRQREFS